MQLISWSLIMHVKLWHSIMWNKFTIHKYELITINWEQKSLQIKCRSLPGTVCWIYITLCTFGSIQHIYTRIGADRTNSFATKRTFNYKNIIHVQVCASPIPFSSMVLFRLVLVCLFIAFQKHYKSYAGCVRAVSVSTLHLICRRNEWFFWCIVP